MQVGSLWFFLTVGWIYDKFVFKEGKIALFNHDLLCYLMDCNYKLLRVCEEILFINSVFCWIFLGILLNFTKNCCTITSW